MARGLGRKRLHHAQHHRKPEEKGKAHPHRRNLQKPQQIFTRRCIFGGHRHLQRQLVAVDQQHGQHDKRQPARNRQRHAPGKRERQPDHQRRCQRPAQAAGDAVHAVGMAQTGRADFAVQQRVVRRMKHPVAQAADHRKARQHPVTGADRIPQRRHAQQGQAAKKNRSRAKPVHHKTRQRLHRARHGEKNRHQKTQFCIADQKLVLEPRKQRREQQLAEMADHVGQTDQANHAGVVAQGNGAGRLVQGA